MTDPFNLQRFIDAQDRVYDRVLGELRRGEKTSHWMWFIFPQLRGLGHSPTAVIYSISSRDEALAYLQHPILGARLTECMYIVNQHAERTLEQIFGPLDSLKFKSCVTLFLDIAPELQVLWEAFDKCGSKEDQATLKLLGYELPE